MHIGGRHVPLAFSLQTSTSAQSSPSRYPMDHHCWTSMSQYSRISCVEAGCTQYNESLFDVYVRTRHASTVLNPTWKFTTGHISNSEQQCTSATAMFSVPLSGKYGFRKHQTARLGRISKKRAYHSPSHATMFCLQITPLQQQSQSQSGRDLERGTCCRSCMRTSCCMGARGSPTPASRSAFPLYLC
jgi:hypothetical protein